jgi:hypothetical protein
MGHAVKVLTVDSAERFWSKVEQSGDCWLWTGGKSRGYGQFWWDGQMRPAHRVSFTARVGEIAAGLELDHLCRNRACVNPAHLEPVSGLENWARGESPTVENVRKEACPKGHAYTPSNTYLHGPKRTWRMCATCHKARVAARKRRLRA